MEKGWQLTPVFLPGESQGQRSLAGYSPRGCRAGRHQVNHTHSRLERELCPLSLKITQFIGFTKAGITQTPRARMTAWSQHELIMLFVLRLLLRIHAFYWCAESYRSLPGCELSDTLLNVSTGVRGFVGEASSPWCFSGAVSAEAAP